LHGNVAVVCGEDRWAHRYEDPEPRGSRRGVLEEASDIVVVEIGPEVAASRRVDRGAALVFEADVERVDNVR
jgi:hypothetical protein